MAFVTCEDTDKIADIRELERTYVRLNFELLSYVNMCN